MKASPGSPPDSNEDSEEQDFPRPKRKIHGLLILAFLLITFTLFNIRGSVTTIDCTPAIMASKPDIIMLGAWWCSYCYQAKKYFQHNDIHYCEYDMENTVTGKQLYEENGAGAIPILLIGKYRLKGFSEQQVETALSSLEKTPK